MARRNRPATVGGWLLDGWIGVGGNGTVWEARRQEADLPAAIKLPKVKRPNAEPYKRFQDEVRILRDLREYPGILPVIDANVPDRPSKDDVPYLVTPIATPITEALEGADLSTVVDAVSTVAETLDRLSREHGLHHRDIKPGNLYRYKESWVVGDFGLVDWPEKAGVTEAGRWVGPRHYMPPEMLDAASVEDFGPVDVYLLMKTFWVMAMGQNYPSILGEQRLDIAGSSLSNAWAHPGVPPLDRLIESGTRTDPRERPTMEQVATELRAWLADPPSPADAPDLDALAARVQSLIGPEMGREKRQREYVLWVNEALDQRIDVLRRIVAALNSLGFPAHMDGEVIPWLLWDWLVRSQTTGMENRLYDFAWAINVELASGSLRAEVGFEVYDDGTVDIAAAWGIGVRPFRRRTQGGGVVAVPWADGRTRVPVGSAQQDQAIDQLMTGLEDSLPGAIGLFIEHIERAAPEHGST